jgi:chloramphenicol 3-O phosphotransferase
MLPFFLHAEGTIIILNGPSASGKSSIQNEIQKQADSLFLKMGIDNLFDALLPNPDLSSFEKTKELKQFTNDHIFIRGVELKTDAEGQQIVPLEIGPAGDKVIFGMHRAIAAYAKTGNNVVVDYILYKPEWLPDLISSLRGTKVYLIGIKAPLSVLEEREKNRGTSPVGHARSHYDQVHKGMIYDLELDVSKLTPEQSAQKILEFVKSQPNPAAVKQLSS